MPELLGTLLPLTALNNSFGSTNLFEAGVQFLDWLVKTRQQAWQLLPLHPTTWGESNLYASPYFGFGAGLNPLFCPELGSSELPPADLDFVKKNSEWLEDYGLFMALSDHFGTDLWSNWPISIRRHETKAINEWRERLADRIEYYRRLQASIHLKYRRLKKAASSAGITIIGDIPFYLPLNCPFVWAYQDCFLLDRKGRMSYVSGAEGGSQFIRQVWGHPLYKWSRLSRILKLWKVRLAYAASLYDWIRLDSAIRFYTYGKMHPTDETLDVVETAPGNKVFVPLVKYCRKLELFVFCEDITDYDLAAVHKTMKRYKIPGVTVFTLNQSLNNLHSSNIYYTSDHDSPTLLGFLQDAEKASEVRQFLLEHCRRLILPLQDWLLTADRINTPGTISSDNWSYTADLSKLKAP